MGVSQLLSLKTKQNSQTALHIFHQNIWGLKHKMDELMCMLAVILVLIISVYQSIT